MDEAVFRSGREREWWDLNLMSRQSETWIASNQNICIWQHHSIFATILLRRKPKSQPAPSQKKKMGPVTRSTANKEVQLENEPTKPKRPLLRLVLKPREVPAETKQPFRCIYCNKTSFVSTKLDFSRKVGHLKCESCGAEFRHKITENLTCAEDVLDALLAGDRLRWITAKQDPANPWWRIQTRLKEFISPCTVD